mgnify:CR=1 FL=1
MEFKKVALFMILAGNLFCTSSAEYWKQVKARADIIYKGMDMNFTLNLSMADYEDSEDNKGGKVSLTEIGRASCRERVYTIV